MPGRTVTAEIFFMSIDSVPFIACAKPKLAFAIASGKAVAIDLFERLSIVNLQENHINFHDMKCTCSEPRSWITCVYRAFQAFA